MSSLIPFTFDDHQIRVQVDEHGKPWWVAKDVCETLGIQNVSDTVNRLKPLESTIIDFSYDGIPHKILLINEPGLYRMIFRSNKPQAQRFQDWVFGEVLPSLRTTGTFSVIPPEPVALPTPQETLDTLATCRAALQALGTFDDRDTIQFSAYIRRVAATAMQPLLPPGTGDGGSLDGAQPVLWTGSMRMQFLKYPPLSGPHAASQQITIGTRAARAYRTTYKEEPKKIWDFVQGQQRQVNAYPPDRLEVLDSAIASVLGPPRLQIVAQDVAP